MDKPRFTPASFIVDREEAFAPLQLRNLADEVRGGCPLRSLSPLLLTPLPPRLAACACAST